jgi:phosphatidylglycerol:prolipoprotein diacylglycerol transferase
VVAILLRVSATRRLRPGSLSLLYLILYGAGRFGLELLRTDTTFRLLGLSRNGWISLVLVVGGSLWLWLRERHRPPSAADDDAEERQWSS